MKKREQRAMEILKAGGSFRRQPEYNRYLGYSQIEHRLVSPEGNVVKGYGYAVFEALREAGMLSYEGEGYFGPKQYGPVQELPEVQEKPIPMVPMMLASSEVYIDA
jgi:hypothetical protein